MVTKLLWILAAGVVFSATTARAVIFHATADTDHNIAAPGGDLSASGWQLQGRWGNFLGTPIGRSYFITASHVGGAVGDSFVFRGVSYTAIAQFDDPKSDLRIWRVCGTFPEFAGLYDNRDEVGKSLVVFGRGTLRGAPILMPTLVGDELKGWRWGPFDGVLRWGQNTIDSVVNGDGIPPLVGVTTGTVGELLKATFDSNGGPNEAHLSEGDSGGAVFVKDGSIWKLAGINYAVDGPYNTSSTGSGLSAAIFDEGGLYKRRDSQWILTPDLPKELPGAFYATRISSNLEWISGVLAAAPEQLPVLQSAEWVTGPYAADPGAKSNSVDGTITIPLPNSARFYRLDSCQKVRITSIRLEASNLQITYSTQSP